MRTRSGVPAPTPHGVSRSASFVPMTDEADIRWLVAEQLGVGIDDITPDVSLTDDLAADSLDLVELALLLEARSGVAISDRRLEQVRTYRDLLEAVTQTLHERRSAADVWRPAFARFRIVPDHGTRPDRAGPLDPYTVDILIDEVRRAGAGARVELEAERDDVVAAARRHLAARGISVSVRRALSPSPLPAQPPPRSAQGSPR